ncbi:MAG: quinohemoprotein amine dehydrogenase [Planctomycetota bacterium]
MLPLVPTYQSFLSLFTAALLAFTLPAQHGEAASAEVPPGHPPAAQNATPAAATPASQNPVGDTTGGKQGATKPPKKRPEKPGIPVEDLLVRSLCGRCHTIDDRSHMTRISYLRKSPEGWAQSIKRMGRLHGLQLTPTTAKMLVRSLSNSHGLSRAEAEKGHYESERRVHWSEDDQDKDFRQACAQCHPLGRALLQYRDKDEWQLLRATHVAMFPLASRQMGGGPPRASSNRSRFGGGNSTGASSPSSSNTSSSNTSSTRGGRGGSSTTSTANTAGRSNAGSSRRGGGTSTGDRVLEQLSKDQPLFTPEWEAWTQHKREVPLAGTWTVHGHETGRGDVIGTLHLARADVDEYTLTWNLNWSDGSSETRTGKGVLYAGYTWRGRSQGPDRSNWREVLLLDENWQTLKGRVFQGQYDEIGMDVTLDRDVGRTRIVSLGNASVPVPTLAHQVDVYGEQFEEGIKVGDFFIGQGLTVTGVERKSDRHLVVTVSAEAGTKLGTRTLAYGPRPGSAKVTLYDTVDYVRVRPLQGLSRNGGAKHPRQLERFEAFAMHRGKDGKPFTKDDVDLFQVRGKWALSEFAVRDNDDDVKYVGAIDEATGVFTPNIDGPNPKRKWQANNIGDVFATFETELDIPVRPPEKKKKEGDNDKPDDAKPDDDKKATNKKPEEPVKSNDADAPKAMPARETKRFFARSHLIVTVPIYARWQVLDWEDR